jgi:tetratricopeptide (TPR) repeat protein
MVMASLARSQATETPAQLFERANAAYEAGNYSAAVEDYEKVAGTGVAAPDLFYNLGNAYFKQGDLGRAVLWFERARRLAPRDADVSENLDLTRSLLRDQELLQASPRWRGVVLSWHHDTTTAESVALASVLFTLVCALGICFVFRDSETVSRAYRSISVLSPGRLLGLDKAQDLGLAMAFAALVTGAFAYSAVSKVRAEHARTTGVVLAEEASVFSGPSPNASVQFKVHEGTLVSVRDERAGWLRVELPGDLSGWIQEPSLARI